MKKLMSYISILILSKNLAKAFYKGIKKVLLRENNEAGYLSQDQFDSCLSRAKAIILEAISGPMHMLALAIAVHREKFHKESHLKEKIEISRQMSKTDVKIASRGWWYS